VVEPAEPGRHELSGVRLKPMKSGLKGGEERSGGGNKPSPFDIIETRGAFGLPIREIFPVG
jgi:hypothetical protein